MITAEKLKIYDSYKGDSDGLARVGRDYEIKLFNKNDWNLIDNFYQDIELINKNLAAQSYIDQVFTKLKDNCDHESLEILNSKIQKYQLKVMKSLFEMLWLQSNHCNETIQNAGYLIFEASKMSSCSKIEVIRHLKLLLNKNYLENISTEPLLYQFTEKGKKIKTESQIEEIINNST